LTSLADADEAASLTSLEASRRAAVVSDVNGIRKLIQFRHGRF